MTTERNKPGILINFVLDETGSMHSVKDATISGFNEYLEQLQRDNPEALFSLTQFNANRVKVVYVGENVTVVKPLTNSSYDPRANTPLYDAIGKSVAEVGDFLSERDRDFHVLNVISTDGLENCSTEYTRDMIVEMLNGKEQEGWTNVFMGAGIDAWSVGQSVGVGNAANVRRSSHTPSGHGANYAALRAATATYAAEVGALPTVDASSVRRDFFRSEGQTQDQETETQEPVSGEWKKYLEAAQSALDGINDVE